MLSSRRTQICGRTRMVADESMIPWNGNGLPHLTFLKRKPHLLGCELKTVCDSSTGVIMYCDIQEGKIRMARKKYAEWQGRSVRISLHLQRHVPHDCFIRWELVRKVYATINARIGLFMQIAGSLGETVGGAQSTLHRTSKDKHTRLSYGRLALGR